MHLIISCSLNKNSKSKLLAEYAFSLFSEEVKMIDLQDFELPFCDGDSCYSYPIVDELKDIIVNAKSIIVASPIYNYDLNAATKNLIELTGRSWTEKVVGVLAAAGGKNSYMSPMSFFNNMMLDFRCIIIPRFVYADRECFLDESIIDKDTKQRIKDLVNLCTRLSNSLL